MSFEITTDRTRMDVALIHDYLSNHSYWATNIPRDVVARSIEHSLCFGVFEHGDRRFVRDELLAALDSWTLAYAVDFHDSVCGRNVQDETKRLLSSAHIALVVLSRNWIASPSRSRRSDLVRRMAGIGTIERAIALPTDATTVDDLGPCEVVDRFRDLYRSIRRTIKPPGHRAIGATLALSTASSIPARRTCSAGRPLTR